ncbi:S41 family peptidase [Ideonella sp.]|uniref:S41 family peptidase n=1 Tax=Ideonella sp. TaxID=1929293 RepID=UPI002B48B254|nr:S41 family peptidase [Ideonella sp.]HJV71653.1 S41 family peptidase [Ideonella sp.]
MNKRPVLRRVAALLGLTAALAAHAETPAPLGPLANPLWLRYSAISPDGQQIAFAFQGNVFVVPASGGVARLLVGNGHHSFSPVWSADGRRIAYASDVYGNFDVFVVDAQGGPSRRLTTHSAPELPLSFTPDGQEVLFSAQRMDARSNLLFPSKSAGELYKVPVDGGKRPTQVFSTPAMAGQFNGAGTQLVYEDWKGYESAWRKHHVSPVARDIWLYDAKTGQHRKLTSFGGEDRNPVWSPDEQAVYYLSEKSGSFNVWKMPIGQPEAATQVTRFTTNPVRFLSVSKTGVLSFGYDGELYTLAPDATEPKKVPVQIAADTRADRIESLKLSEGVTEIAPSPDGSEIAFVVRGEVFVASTEFGDTRRITTTPGAERSVSFSPDGRRLLFAGEQGGSWNLYEAALPGKKKDSPAFFVAAAVPVKTLLKNGKENFQPRYSPDGKEVAYLENRTTLKVLNLASGKTREVLPGTMNYSYSDGDQWFDWSPDGKSLLVNFIDHNRWSNEVGLIDVQGKGPLLNLTKSGYEDVHPIWTRSGKAMLWFSDRMGLHGTGGAAQQDIFEMFFTQEAFDRFNLEKSEFALLKKQEDDDKKDDDKKDGDKQDKDKPTADGKKKGKGEDDEAAIKLPEPVKIERDNLEDRVVRLTQNSGPLRAAAMTPDGETLFYAVQTAEAVELWSHKPRQKATKKVAEVPAPKEGGHDEQAPIDVQLDAKGEMGFLLAGGGIRKFKVPKEDGEVKAEPVEFAAEMMLDRSAERAEMFEHIWRQTREKLYVADMEKVDWAGYKKVYERYLPYITDNHDFAEAMSEMLGELNVSHTGSGYRPHAKDVDATAALGAFYDEAWRGPGVKVAEVIESGPLVNAKVHLKAGMVIEKIDGVAIAAGAEYDSLLNRKAGKRVELTVLDPATGKRFEQVVKPVALAEQNELLYKRWVKRQRETVDKLSNGRLGYVHVRGMDDESFRDVFSEALGRHSGKEALIVDTRFNGGGNLTDALATFLAGKKYLEFLPRGQSLGWEPTGKWAKPSIVLMSESNYSDAHLFPWTYRKLGIGKLLGMPVAGTGTAVWWETLQDDTLYFGIPEVGIRDEQGTFMEKALIEPDIRVANDPALIAAGRDEQTEAAVKALLGAK